MLVKILDVKATKSGKARTITTDQGTVMIGGKLTGVEVSVGFMYMIEVNKVESTNPKYPGSSLWVASIQPSNQLPPIQTGTAQKPLEVVRTDNPAQVKAKNDHIDKLNCNNNSAYMTHSLALIGAANGAFNGMKASEVKDYLVSVQKEFYIDFMAKLVGFGE